jgi:hypothetical protein
LLRLSAHIRAPKSRTRPVSCLARRPGTFPATAATPAMPMKKILAAVALALLSSLSHAGQAAEQVNAYFDLWLKEHQFRGYEKRADGLWFTANGMRLDGDIYQIKELTKDKFYSLESRISLTFPDGRKLEDFVVGAGANPQDAFVDSLQNFCLTTLHPIYAELFDHADPHVRKDTWTIAGAPRRVFLSAWGQRGDPFDEATQAAVERRLAQALAGDMLSDEIHWLKVVVLMTKDKLETVVVTIDGQDIPALDRSLAAYDWPHPERFTMAKLFIVIGKR